MPACLAIPERSHTRTAAIATILVTLLTGSAGAEEPSSAATLKLTVSSASALREFCLDCHNTDEMSGDFDLSQLLSRDFASNTASWEKVVRKLRARQMPPPDAPRPSGDDLKKLIESLESRLDKLASEHPKPGRTDTIRRLTRTEYGNAIRDLLALDVNVDSLLPSDESSHGFDNVTVGDLSPTLLNRYISAAQKISRLAVGGATNSPGGDTIRVRADVTQEEHVEGLPIGTRGGALIPYTFPQDGEYEITVRLARDRNEHVEGLRSTSQLEVMLDRRRLRVFDIQRPKGPDHSKVDAHLKLKFRATAGPHKLGVAFLKKPSSLLETKRQPYQAHFNMHRHPRLNPAVFQVSITGPWVASGSGDTPSRRRIFIARPDSPDQEDECARSILAHLTRRAFRRSITDSDLAKPLRFFREARQSQDFEAGIQSALTSILVSPDFLLRVEREPQNANSGEAYALSNVDLASRLSFFLWSSLPDDELLDAAEAGQLSDPDVLEEQTRRMLADPRSQTLITNFASQWLYLRNLESITPDLRLFPDFDDNLRQAFRKETELLFKAIVREDRSVLDLLRADFTFLNERLAKHYDIPHVNGSRFRRVQLESDSHRGGLLRHGSILTVTSYATRTSPVIRGHWILKNLLGAEPPPPPPDVPALSDNTVSASLPIRERLAEHRTNPICASCHDALDPVGFSLENFDAVGRWREMEAGKPVDATGSLPDGSQFTGVSGLERAILKHPELFVGTMVEKLLTFALGRGVEYYDAVAIRKVVRDAAKNDYRFADLVVGLVRSVPFTMRSAK